MFKKNVSEVIAIIEQDLWKLEDVKNYLRISDSYDDNLIKNLIDTAITAVENFTNLSIYNRHIKYICNIQGKKNFHLKYQPICKISKISISDGSKMVELSAEEYYLDVRNNILFLEQPINEGELIFEYVSGFDPKNIPSSIKHGILLHVAEIYDREEAFDAPFSKIVRNLYLPYKQLRI